MKRVISLPPFRLTCVVLVAMLGCGTGSTYAVTTSIYPVSLDANVGVHSEQPVHVLSTRDQSVRSDDWESYIEFYASQRPYKGTFEFRLPAHIKPSSVTALKLEANYRGPKLNEQRWQWRILNVIEKKWVFLGDNRGVRDWFWSPLSFAVSGKESQFIKDKSIIRVRYISREPVDDSDLDYLALAVTHESHDPLPPPTPPSDGGVWQPSPGTTWQWQLTGALDTSVDVDMYAIDLFETPGSVIDELHAKGKITVCYFSAGSWENWREDAGRFDKAVLGRSNGWPGEKWLDIRRMDVLGPILQDRLDLAVQKGCNGVEPDNVDGYSNNTGFSLTYEDQRKFNIWLANAAHDRGLSIALKNDLDQVEDLVEYFDWALNEQCFEYSECDLLSPFLQAGKAVFGVEYTGDPASFCPRANRMGMDWQKKRMDLDSWRIDCKEY